MLFITFFCMIYCALCYAIKGGQHGWLRRFIGERIGIVYGRRMDGSAQPVWPWKWWQGVYLRASDGKYLSAILFAGLATYGAAEGTNLWIVFLCAAAGWLAAVSPSVGEEIGAVGGYKGGWGEYITNGFGRWYGVKKAAQRGVWMTTCLFIGLLPGSVIHPLLFVGFVYPVIIWLAVSFLQWKAGKAQVDWGWHEPFVGAAIGLALVL